MPQFDNAQEVRSETSYLEFLRTCALDTAIDLPLDSDESPRAIKRRLTVASRELGLRLRHLRSDDPAVIRFRVTGSPGVPRKIYRAGVVGLTGMGMRLADHDPAAVLNTPMPHSHVGSYAVLPHTEVVAVCDLRSELFDAFREQWGHAFPRARTYTDYREMIDKENLDLLSVTTGDNAHTDIVIYGANHGVQGIACEKPLATTLDDATRMIAACEANGTLISVDHTRRWWLPYHVARQLIRDGAIGQVQRIIAHMGGTRAMLFRNGTHLLDGVLFFAESDAEWVFAELDPGFEDYFAYRGDGGKNPALDPSGSGYIHFRNGVRAFINASKGQTPGMYIQVIGETGEIDLVGDHVELHKDGAVHQPPMPSHRRTDVVALIDELTRVIEQGGELVGSGQEARKVVEIIVGFLKSQERGNARVNLPLPPGN